MSSIIISLLLISVLVVAHEFGHFIVAKKAGICVEEFAVGMGKKIFSYQKGETEYSLRLLPLGGFCRMEGETDEGEIGPKSFLNKPVHIRLMVMAAGPFMNFVLALVMIFGIASMTYSGTPVVQDVLDNMPAQAAGLQAGDKILKINDSKMHIYDEIQSTILKNQEKPMTLEVLRDGEKYMIELLPVFDTESNRYMIGFSPVIAAGMFAESREGYGTFSVSETIYYSYYSMLNYVKITAEGLARVFTFTASQDEYGGPITIVQMIGDGYEAGLAYSLKDALLNVVYIGSVLSANLGVLNLFPIPALDGGKILLLLVEAVRRKPLSVELENRIQVLGFTFLMGLMVYVLFGDIVKLIA